MVDRDVKELLIGFVAILIFAVAIVYFRQRLIIIAGSRINRRLIRKNAPSASPPQGPEEFREVRVDRPRAKK
jgi:hypothetical protein